MKPIHYALIAAALILGYFLFFRSGSSGSDNRYPSRPIPLDPSRPRPPPPTPGPPTNQQQIDELTKTYCKMVAEVTADPSLEQKMKPEIIAIVQKLVSLGLRTQPQC